MENNELLIKQQQKLEQQQQEVLIWLNQELYKSGHKLDINKYTKLECIKIANMLKAYNLSLTKKEAFIVPFSGPYNTTNLQLVIAYPTFINRAKQIIKNYYRHEFIYNIEPKDITGQNILNLTVEVKIYDKKNNLLTNHYVKLKQYMKYKNDKWVLPLIWQQQPFVMLQKVALVQALRLIGVNLGAYVQEELNEENKLEELPENKTQESAQKNASDALKLMEENK